MSDWMALAVKFKGKCAECGKEISAGERALWSKSNKAIKHLRCEPALEKKKEAETPKVPELDCFICGKPAGCAECGFEAQCDRQMVSQECICGRCLHDENAFDNYQEAFVEKARKFAKVKI